MKTKKGFTLSEVLIALTVIGIIAAITISIITENARKTEIETKLKKAVSVLNSAMYKASIDYGPANQWPEFAEETTNQNKDANIENVVKKYIGPYLITQKPVDNISLKDLGYKEGIKTPMGGYYTRIGSDITKTYPTIILNDGTTFLRLDYVSLQYEYIIDINGPKGPNIAGKDVFQLAIDTTKQTPIARTLVTKGQRKDSETGEIYYIDSPTLNTDNSCGKAGLYCAWVIEQNGWKIPDDYPIKI